ncbi:MAG: hypothetical protein WC516_08605 [Patescibacteria group bacterium]
MRKSEAKDLLCPKCLKPSLIKAGKTPPIGLLGHIYQRYRCMNKECSQTITICPVYPEKKMVEVQGNDEVIVVRRGKNGRFLEKE